MKPIFLLGDNRGETEDKLNLDFVSTAGAELIRMLGEAGILSLTSFDRDYIHRYYTTNDPRCLAAIWALHPEVYRTNVFKIKARDLEFFCGPKAEGIPGYPALIKSKYVRQEFEPELERLCHEILSVDPNIIICFGNLACWALSGATGITKVRGTTSLSTRTVLDYKLLPTYHPSAVLRQWELRPTIVADLMKAKRESEYGEIRRPIREVWIEPTLDDIQSFIEQHINGCDLLSVDIETSGSRITCIGFAPTPRIAIVIPFDDWRATNGNYWPTREAEQKCWRLIRRILADPSSRKLFQNGAYDIAFLWRAYGIKTINAAEDTMLLSHALQPESKKGLGYLGSIYSDEGSWKHMRKKDETIKRDA